MKRKPGTERRKVRIGTLSALAAAVAACSGGSGGDARLDPADTGSLSVAVTDAPVDDAAAVVVTMTELELKPAGDEASFTVPVIEGTRELNLLELTDGGTADLVVDEEVPAGDYEWLRIHLEEDGSYIQLESDGTTYPLVIPSGAQTGYKAVGGFTVPVNDDARYLLDFDVRRSVVEPPGLSGPNGEARTFLLKPTVRILNAEETGGVSGAVAMDLVDLNNARCLDNGLEGNAVYVFEGADAELDDVADEDEEEDGRDGPLTSDVVELNEETGVYEYHLMYLLPGTYTLAFTCSAGADGIGDDDYPAPSDSGFDFDATINVEIVSDEIKSCDIPGVNQSDPC